MFYSFHKDGEAQAVARWVADRIPGCERGFGPCAAMAVFDGGIVAGVVFHNYSPEGGVLELSTASESPRWLTRPVIWAMHNYVFENCQMAVLRVSERNDRMLRIAQRFGYTPHRIPRLRGRDEAEIILTLTDDDWRRIEVKYGQAVRSKAA